MPEIDKRTDVGNSYIKRWIKSTPWGIDTIYIKPTTPLGGPHIGVGVWHGPDGRRVVGEYEKIKKQYNEDAKKYGEYNLGPSSARIFKYVTPDNPTGNRYYRPKYEAGGSFKETIHKYLHPKLIK